VITSRCQCTQVFVPACARRAGFTEINEGAVTECQILDLGQWSGVGRDRRWWRSSSRRRREVPAPQRQAGNDEHDEIAQDPGRARPRWKHESARVARPMHLAANGEQPTMTLAPSGPRSCKTPLAEPQGQPTRSALQKTSRCRVRLVAWPPSHTVRWVSRRAQRPGQRITVVRSVDPLVSCPLYGVCGPLPQSALARHCRTRTSGSLIAIRP